jgi:hypothetical protein
VAEPALGIGLIVTLGTGVTAVTIRIEAGKGLKVATTALHLQMVALVHIPDFFVALPGWGHSVPGRRRVMTLGAILAAPLWVPGLVTVCADVVQPLKIGEIVALEAMQLAVRPSQLDRVARRINF